jgi:DNA-binding CsgD family transcriptional regulator
MATAQTAIAEMIRTIGSDDFPRVTARALSNHADFDIALIVLHKPRMRPALLFDNFDARSGRLGVDNYLSFTHQLNPFLRRVDRWAALRARDFRVAPRGIREDVRSHVTIRPEEELGFLTVGWPAHLEEVGLYFQAYGGIVELSLYREQAGRPISSSKVEGLAALCQPIAAAFDRHYEMTHQRTACMLANGNMLSPREGQIVDLLLTGCSSEAVSLRLGMSLHTVKSYRKQIFRKLDICSLAELFALCRGAGKATVLH